MQSTRRQFKFAHQDASDDLRTSIFEAFLELGAFDQGSELLEWVFSDESTDYSSPAYVGPEIFVARESKYFERFDSASILQHFEEDPENAGILQRSKSFCSKHIARRTTNAGSALPLARKQSLFTSKSPTTIRIEIKKERSSVSSPSPARRRVTSAPQAYSRPCSPHGYSTLWW